LIRADDNLLSHLTSELVDGTLRLDTRGSFRTHTTPQVYLTVPDLESVHSSGSGDAFITDVANRGLELVMQGSGDMRALGRTGDLKVIVQGSGDADMRGLAAERADISVMGSGNIWVATRGAVNAQSLGSGNVYVLGKPAALSVNEGGSGRVIVRSR
jgi:hypothetical protein